MSNRKIRNAVERAAAQYGAAVEWIGGTRHDRCTITLPDGREIHNGVSQGMDFDETRVFKIIKSKLKKLTGDRNV